MNVLMFWVEFMPDYWVGAATWGVVLMAPWDTVRYVRRVINLVTRQPRCVECWRPE